MHQDDLSDAARRLTLAAGLTRRAALALGERISADAAERDLLALARRLGPVGARVERAHELVFDPAYPGRTAGVEPVGGGLRLVLACSAAARGVTFGVVFTTLIAGRPPQVTVGPPEAPIPVAWAAVAD